MSWIRAQIRGEDGQATAEFVVSLIGILIVFTGFLMIMDLGVAKVENVAEARGEADVYSALGIGGGSGLPIRSWDAGEDEFYYTEDDQRVVSTTEDPNVFSDELSIGWFSLVSGFSHSYVRHNFASSLDPDRVFLPAADLAFGSSSRIVELDGATRALYFNTPSLSLSDTVYMPVID